MLVSCMQIQVIHDLGWPTMLIDRIIDQTDTVASVDQEEKLNEVSPRQVAFTPTPLRSVSGINDLANSLITRFEHSGRLEDLDHAVL